MGERANAEVGIVGVVGWWVGLLVLALLLGVGALGYMYHLAGDEPKPPMGLEEASAVEGPIAPPKASRLVVVVVDAAREDLFLDAAVMPELAAIAAQGRRGVSITQPITMTLLSVLNLGTGLTPGLGWSVQNFEADAFGDESLFFWAKAKGLRVALVGDAAWSQLFGRWSDYINTFPDGGLYDDVVGGGLTRKDAQALEGAAKALGEPASGVVVVHLVSSDKISHKRGALVRDASGRWTPYADVAHRIDAEIGTLYKAFARPGDVWLITSDHGATDWGNHGGGEEVARRAPFVLAGAGVSQGPDGVEVSLNVWAPSLSVVLGLPIPRRAEAAAALELLDLTAQERSAVLAHHAARRLEVLDAMGESVPGSREAGSDEEALRLIQDVGRRVEGIKERRRGFRAAGEALGAMLMTAALAMVWGHRREVPLVARLAVTGVWVIGLTALMGYDDWLYTLADLLGGLDLGTLATLAGLGFGGWLVRIGLGRWQADARVKDGLGWSLWGVAVVATSEVVVKWPFGPLTQMFLALWLGLVGLVGFWVWGGLVKARVWGWMAGGVWGFWVIWWGMQRWGSAHLQTLAEGPWTGLLSWLGVGGFVGWWASRAFGEGRWRGLMGLGVLAAGLYRVVGVPWAAWVALVMLGLQGLGIWWWSRGWTPAQKRAGVWGFALALGHVMASDWVVLAWLATVPLWVAVSQANWRELPGGIKALTWTLALLDISLFYLIGYRYSLSAVDVQVVFMLDRDGINLGVGLVLLLMQHAAPWLMSWGAIQDAGFERRTLLWALLVVIVLRCWGPFWALAYHAENFWFVSHAVPMFVMSLGVGIVILGSGWVVERMWQGRLPSKG